MAGLPGGVKRRHVFRALLRQPGILRGLVVLIVAVTVLWAIAAQILALVLGIPLYRAMASVALGLFAVACGLHQTLVSPTFERWVNRRLWRFPRFGPPRVADLTFAAVQVVVGLNGALSDGSVTGRVLTGVWSAYWCWRFLRRARRLPTLRTWWALRGLRHRRWAGYESHPSSCWQCGGSGRLTSLAGRRYRCNVCRPRA